MRHLLFICLLLFCVACEENESVDPTIMPEATTTGANTFGCLVDGWVYTSGRWGMPSAEYLEREEGSSVTVSAQVGLGSYIRFTIADPKEGETLPYVNLSFEMARSTSPVCRTACSAALSREDALRKAVSI